MLHLDRLLFPTDFSACSAQAFPHALFLARTTGATLHLLHVVVSEALQPFSGEAAFLEEQEAQAEAGMDELLATHDLDGVEVVRTVASSDAAAPVVLDYAERRAIDLIVVGTHGRRRLKRWFMGSVAEEVVRGAACPVFAVREHDDPFPVRPLDQVLAAVDLHETSQRVVRHATGLAARYEACLDLLHVIEETSFPRAYGELPPATPATLNNVGRQVRTELLRLVEEAEHEVPYCGHHVVSGFVATHILDFARQHDVDVIVLASHGRTGFKRFLLGSVAEKVMRQTPCPIYIVK